ncbi:hypothetical protein BC829DRAFT_473784 [Chytridium lagenaria]|nr:hypothetical protein BC829DRAFT_473784 [Chytridium lagenaria]
MFVHDPVIDSNGTILETSLVVLQVPADLSIPVEGAQQWISIIGIWGGAFEVFAANDANVVPKMKVGIAAGFKWLVRHSDLPLERVINVGELLLASGFVSHTTLGSSSSLTEAAGSPVGIHLRDVMFDLVVDQNTLAKCFIPRLDVTAGDIDLTIP